MAEFPLPVLHMWRSRKWVAIQIQSMNIHVSDCKYYCLHLVSKFGKVCYHQNWRLHPTAKDRQMPVLRAVQGDWDGGESGTSLATPHLGRVAGLLCHIKPWQKRCRLFRPVYKSIQPTVVGTLIFTDIKKAVMSRDDVVISCLSYETSCISGRNSIEYCALEAVAISAAYRNNDTIRYIIIRYVSRYYLSSVHILRKTLVR